MRSLPASSGFVYKSLTQDTRVATQNERQYIVQSPFPAPMFLRKVVLALVAFLVFSIPLASGQLSFDFSVGPFGLMSLVGLLAFLSAAASLLFGHRGLGRTTVPMDLSVTLLAIFVALNFASVGWARDSTVAINSSISYFQILVFVWLLLFLRPEPKTSRVIVHAFFAGSVLLVANSLYDVLSIGLDAFERQRVGGFDIQVNRFAFKMALGIPVAFYLFQRGLSLSRWVYLAYVPAAVFLAFLTGSRTGAVAALFALLAGLWLVLKVEDRGRPHFSLRRLLIFTAVGAVLLTSVVPFVVDRFAYHADRIASVADPMDAAGSSTNGTGFGGRGTKWRSAFAVYLDNPVLGVGSGGSRTAMLDYIGHEGLIISLAERGQSVHNSYLAIASETGTVGMLLYLAIIVTLIVRIRSFPRREKLLFLSMMGVALITAITGTVETMRDFNLALFLSVSALQRHQLSELEEAESGGSPLPRRSRAHAGDLIDRSA